MKIVQTMPTDNNGVVHTSSEFGDETYPAIIQRPDGADLFALKLTRRQLEVVLGMLGLFQSPNAEFNPTESQQLYSLIFDAARALNVETSPYTTFSGIKMPPAVVVAALLRHLGNGADADTEADDGKG